MEELRKYWEVPAIAHFCSLFRQVFKLVDFDIEEFEEALIVDTESAEEGGRSSLICDLLIALIRGCINRKDVSLLNYNQFTHDLLELLWVAEGLGQNPLGEDREKACFHLLPLYAKAKVLHLLCEYRLQRADVEPLTKNLAGDSLRIQPLGHDESGATYWYFYGTRLYKEEREQIKLTIKNPTPKKPVSDDAKTQANTSNKNLDEEPVSESEPESRKKNKKDTSPVRRSGRKRKPKSWGSPYANSKKRRQQRAASNGSAKAKEFSDSDIHLDDENENDEQISERSKSPASQIPPNEDEKDIPNDVEDSPSNPAKGSSNPSKGSPSNPSKGSPSKTVDSTGVPGSFNDMIRRIYSTEDDDSRSSCKASEDEKDAKPNLNSISEFVDAGIRGSTPHVPPGDVNSQEADVKEKIDSEKQEIFESSEKTWGENEKNWNENESKSTGNRKRPFIPIGPPPWDQENLKPTDLRWSVVCFSFDDWKKLAESFANSKSKTEKDLHRVLTEDFLPAIEQLFLQREREKAKKLAELMPRRASDRLEVKRLQREHEEKLLAEREAEELAKVEAIEAEKRARIAREEREKRLKEREKEREKRMLTQQKAREDRTRRLELRKLRQQLIAEGKDIPPELESGYMNDLEMSELDREIELDYQYGQLEKILHAVINSEDAWPFEDPVTEEIAPGYFDVIEKPMDFIKIEEKLNQRAYDNKIDFIDDLNTMFLNCLRYNGTFSDYTKAAQRLERCLIKSWRKNFPPNDYVEKSESVKRQELACIEKLGALDKKIHEELAKENADDDEESTSSGSSGPSGGSDDQEDEEDRREFGRMFAAERDSRRRPAPKIQNRRRRMPIQPVPFANWSPSPMPSVTVGTLMFSGTSTGTTVVNVLNRSPQQAFQVLNRNSGAARTSQQTPLLMQSGGRPLIATSGGAATPTSRISISATQPDHDFGQTTNPSYSRMMELETATRTGIRATKQRSPTNPPQAQQSPASAGITFRPIRATTGSLGSAAQSPRIFVAGQRISIPGGGGRASMQSIGGGVSRSALPAGSQVALIAGAGGAGSSMNLISSAPIETFGDRPTIAMNDKHDAKLLPSGEIVVVERIPTRSGPMQEVEKGKLFPGEKLYERLADKFRAVGYKIPSPSAKMAPGAGSGGVPAVASSSARPICSVAPTLKAQPLGTISVPRSGAAIAGSESNAAIGTISVPRSPSVSMVAGSGSAPSYIIVNSGGQTGSQAATVQLGTLVNIGNNRMVVVPIQNQTGGQAMLVQPQIVVNAPNQRQMIVHAASTAAAGSPGVVVRSAGPSATVGQAQAAVVGDHQETSEGSAAGAADDLLAQAWKSANE